MDFLRINVLLNCERGFLARNADGPSLNETECKICTYIHQNPLCSQDNVARSLKLDKTTVAKALLCLENKGLVTRNIDKQDRRRKMLSITPEGEKISRALRTAHDEWLEKILVCLTPEERANFDNYCTRILKTAEQIIAEDRENA